MRSRKKSGPALGRECKGWNECSSIKFLKQTSQLQRQRIDELESLLLDAFNCWNAVEIDKAIRNGSYDARTPDIMRIYEQMVSLGLLPKQTNTQDLSNDKN